ncbi:hypothetical protein RHOER0001_3961 [Rhodococcus erythropolis SK121]|nr:hypothetical protein RHOER0001_3961 [Rhodococcus erythropolis SK121]
MPDSTTVVLQVETSVRIVAVNPGERAGQKRSASTVSRALRT